ncbi:MAG: relaxase/mobilization nuclease domain-containing protein [Devosia sp.]
MIVKGNQRGGATALARHLLNREDNDHVTVQELRGFASGTLSSAMQEALAISKGTQCRKFLFSVSLNPPENANVTAKDLAAAADKVEERLGLSDQPRALVIHEKEGRRHGHAVWSRINAETMTAIKLDFYKFRLKDVSKELFREHGWRMPEGLKELGERDPSTFTREEWQQAKRVRQDAAKLKGMFRECWETSDNAASLGQALSERGFVLARGDRRAAVAVDYRGEVYALARWSGVKTKEVKARLGDLDALPDVSAAKSQIASRMSRKVEGYIADVQNSLKRGAAILALKKAQLKERHLAEREALKEEQAQRWVTETQERAARFRSGMRGLWDRISGRHKQTRRENEAEAYKAIARDDLERESLVANQLEERRALQADVKAMRTHHHEEMGKLREDALHYASLEDRGASPDRIPEPSHSHTKTMQQIERERGSGDRDPSR